MAKPNFGNAAKNSLSKFSGAFDGTATVENDTHANMNADTNSDPYANLPHAPEKRTVRAALLLPPSLDKKAKDFMKERKVSLNSLVIAALEAYLPKG